MPVGMNDSGHVGSISLARCVCSERTKFVYGVPHYLKCWTPTANHKFVPCVPHYLGYGITHPIALEAALKLKEISYIHAEAYAAGELKHGPLALVDADMPIIAVAPNDQLLEKLKSNLQEVKARGGQLYVFADPNVSIGEENGTRVLAMPDSVEAFQSPIIYTLPLQLLAYHVAVLKGTDVDQPRNLAKSVTVE